MKYLFILVCMVPFYNTTHAQIYNPPSQSSIGFSLGGNFSQVRFKNSDGVLDEDLKGLPGTSATLFYFLQLANGKKGNYAFANLLGVELGYKSSKFQDKANSLLTTWNLQYLTGQLTFRHVVLSDHRVNLFFGSGVAIDYLRGGTQTQGFNQFEITEDLNRVNLSILVETGLKYNISEDAYTTLRLGYLRGLTNLEKDPEQEVFIHAVRLSIAVLFYLDNSKKY